MTIISQKFGSYEEAIKKEAEFWGQFVKSTIQSGIPFRCDWRRAQKVKRESGREEFPDDPKMLDIIMGDTYRLLLNKILENRGGGAAIDLGCGPGGLALEVARNGLDVTAIDVSKESIEVAEHFRDTDPYKEGRGNLDYIVADLNRINLPENTYDVIFSGGSLHHILCVERLVGEIKVSLKPNGKLIIYDSCKIRFRSPGEFGLEIPPF